MVVRGLGPKGGPWTVSDICRLQTADCRLLINPKLQLLKANRFKTGS